jgi:hypothetical protein
VRAPRAYLAGFGTSGSLLAGAALLFVLASAFIGFQGWPQVGDSPSTVAVSLPQAPLGTTTSRAGRVLAATKGSRTFGTSSRARGLNSGGAARLGGVGSTRPIGSRLPGNPAGPGGGPMQVGTTSPTLPGSPSTTPAGHTGPTPSRCPAGGCAQTPVSVPPPVRQPVHHAAGTVHKVVTTVTGQLPGSGGNSNSGSVVHHAAGAAGGAASSASSTAHHAASGAGSTVHHAASGASSAVHRILP